MKSHDAGDVVVLMARRPRAGEVKTRLAASIGADAARALYTAFLEDIIAESRGPWRLVAAVTPADAVSEFEERYPELDGALAQPSGSLSDRMIDVFHRTLHGGSRVVMRNTDSPTLPKARIADAFAALDATDAVLGPDLGGGYYLVGLSRPRPELFRIEMSTSTVLEETLRRGELDGRAPALLEPHLDVDDAEDLEHLIRSLREDETAARCPRTCSELERLGKL